MIKSLSAIQLENKPKLIVDEIDIADPVGNQVMIKLISKKLFTKGKNLRNSK